MRLNTMNKAQIRHALLCWGLILWAFSVSHLFMSVLSVTADIFPLETMSLLCVHLYGNLSTFGRRMRLCEQLIEELIVITESHNVSVS